MPQGLPPRLMRRSTAPVATSTIETSPAGPLAVNSLVPSALTPMPHGRWPTSSMRPHEAPLLDVDHRDRLGPAVRHEQQLRVRRQHRAHRPRRHRCLVGPGQPDRVGEGAARRVQHRDRPRVLVGDEQRPAVRGDRDRARPLADQDTAEHRERRGVDGDDAVVVLAGDVDDLAVRRDRHALGLVADLHALRHRARRHVDHRHLRRLLVRDVEPAPVGREIEGFGILAAVDGADDLARRDVDDGDAVRRAIGRRQRRLVDAGRRDRRPGQRDVQLLAVARHAQAARALADRDGGEDVAGGRIDHRDGARRLVAHVDALRRRRAAARPRGTRRPPRRSARPPGRDDDAPIETAADHGY